MLESDKKEESRNGLDADPYCITRDGHAGFVRNRTGTGYGYRNRYRGGAGTGTGESQDSLFVRQGQTGADGQKSDGEEARTGRTTSGGGETEIEKGERR